MKIEALALSTVLVDNFAKPVDILPDCYMIPATFATSLIYAQLV